VRSNMGRLTAAVFAGFTAAVLVRGASGCSSGGTGTEMSEAPSPAVQTAGAREPDSMPDGIIDLANETCPVMGGPVAEGQYVDWNGFRVHFCCAGCDSRFLADPERYVEILSHDPRVAELLGEGSVE